MGETAYGPQSLSFVRRKTKRERLDVALSTLWGGGDSRSDARPHKRFKQQSADSRGSVDKAMDARPANPDRIHVLAIFHDFDIGGATLRKVCRLNVLNVCKIV